jgi:phosphatidylserine decarboxylase
VNSPTLRNRLFVALQHALPQHFLSRMVLRATRIRSPAIKNTLISRFVSGFRPNMTEAAQPDPLAYGSFNEFFTRSLRGDARPVDPNPAALISPVDGTVSQIGPLDGSRILQAKGHDYTVESLLARPEWVDRFRGGTFATLYLAPYNYHRIHMPLAGALRAAWFVPGKLFSVNATTAAAVPELFARNERVVCVFEHTGNVHPGSPGAEPQLFAMILVGALFVGSISTVWHGDITPFSPRRAKALPLDGSRAPLSLEKGDEMGRFNMGSTVILLLAPGMARWLPSFGPGAVVRYGEALGTLS